MKKPIPLLWVSDSVSCSSGLGRISRDICSRIATDMPDVFRVASFGYGSAGRRALPFFEYHAHSVDNWLLPELPEVWADWAGDEEGIVMFCWDLSRFWWINSPQAPAHIRQWLQSAKMKKWLYHPIDAEGPNGKLSLRLAETMKCFDRVLDYSAFSCRVTGNTEHLPHGIDTEVFKPYRKLQSKRTFRGLGFKGLEDDSFMVGIVATNQGRKDWALGMETCRLLLNRGLDVRVWCHTDVLERFWSLPNLVHDFGLQDRVCITNTRFTDEQMAEFYSACDVTLSIGLGEGFGFPAYEALACGTPVVAGDYCGSEWMDDKYKVPSMAWRYEGIYACKRPVYDPPAWASIALQCHGEGTMLAAELDWNNLWPRWKEWLLRGIE